MRPGDRIRYKRQVIGDAVDNSMCFTTSGCVSFITEVRSGRIEEIVRGEGFSPFFHKRRRRKWWTNIKVKDSATQQIVEITESAIIHKRKRRKRK